MESSNHPDDEQSYRRDLCLSPRSGLSIKIESSVDLTYVKLATDLGQDLFTDSVEPLDIEDGNEEMKETSYDDKELKREPTLRNKTLRNSLDVFSKHPHRHYRTFDIKLVIGEPFFGFPTDMKLDDDEFCHTFDKRTLSRLGNYGQEWAQHLLEVKYQLPKCFVVLSRCQELSRLGNYSHKWVQHLLEVKYQLRKCSVVLSRCQEQSSPVVDVNDNHYQPSLVKKSATSLTSHSSKVPPVRVQTRRKRSVTKLQCDICSSYLTSHAYLKRHKLTHERTILSCLSCNQVFTSQRDLLCHRESHKLYKCDTCDKEYNSSSGLYKHKQDAHNGSEFACFICDFKTVRKYRLKEHWLLHWGQ